MTTCTPRLTGLFIVLVVEVSLTPQRLRTCEACFYSHNSPLTYSRFAVYKDADLMDFVNAPVGKGLPISETLRPLIAGRQATISTI